MSHTTTLYRLITVPAKVATVFPAAVFFAQRDARVLLAVASKHIER
jgi:hypothetical protein